MKQKNMFPHVIRSSFSSMLTTDLTFIETFTTIGDPGCVLFIGMLSKMKKEKRVSVGYIVLILLIL